MARLLHRAHHAVGTDHNQPVNRTERNLPISEFAASVGRRRLHDISHEGAVLYAPRREARRLVAAPDHHIRRLFDFIHLVPVDDLLIAGEVDDARSFLPEFLTYGEKYSVAE